MVSQWMVCEGRVDKVAVGAVRGCGPEPQALARATAVQDAHTAVAGVHRGDAVARRNVELPAVLDVLPRENLTPRVSTKEGSQGWLAFLVGFA